MTKLRSDVVKYSSRPEPYAGDNQPYEERVKASIPFLKLIDPKLKSVLVVGCGEGYEVKWLIDHGFEAVGLTKNADEARMAKKKYGVKAYVGDIHELPFSSGSFDCVYGSNILEHSVAPYVALMEWRRVLKMHGWLITVLPSKEWIPEYYHFSVLTHAQSIDLMKKAGYKILAAPGSEKLIDYRGGDIYLDLGRGRGHYDAYVGEKSSMPTNKYMLGPDWRENHEGRTSLPIKIVKLLLKYPYNAARRYYERYIREY